MVAHSVQNYYELGQHGIFDRNIWLTYRLQSQPCEYHSRADIDQQIAANFPHKEEAGSQIYYFSRHRHPLSGNICRVGAKLESTAK